MTTAGFFRQTLDPSYRFIVSRENIEYIQREVAKRLGQKFIEYIEVPYWDVESSLIFTMGAWKFPLSISELLEKVICDFVESFNNEYEDKIRFNSYDPMKLYKANSDITREEKVKLKAGYKFEFQMNY